MRRRSILSLTRILVSCKTGTVASIRRYFSDIPTNNSFDVSRKTGFEALGASWTVEPLSTGLNSSGIHAVRVSCGSTVVLARVQTVHDGGMKSWRGSQSPNVLVEYKEHYHAMGMFPPIFDRRGTLVTSRERRISSNIRNMVESLVVPEVSLVGDVWVDLSVLSSHEEYDSEIVAMNAASIALSLSPEIPWYGPAGAVRIFFGKEKEKEKMCSVSVLGKLRARKEGIGHGVNDDAPSSMLVICTKNGILQVRGDAHEIDSKSIKDGLQTALNTVRDTLVRYQLDHGAAKFTGQILRGADPSAARRIHDHIDALISEYFKSHPNSSSHLDEYVQSTLIPSVKNLCSQQGRWRSEASRIKGSGCVTKEDVKYVTTALIEKYIKDAFFNDGKRLDGRSFDDIIPDSVDMGCLPGCHGSSMYSAGGTSVVTAVTCGSLLENANTEYRKSGSEFTRVSSACMMNQNKGRGRHHNNDDDVTLSEFLSSTFSRLVPGVDKIPFCFRISTEIITMDGCLLSSCLNAAAMAMQHLGVRLSHPCGAATVGLACRFPEGSLDGEEQSMYLNEKGICNRQEVGDHKIIADPSGLESLALDATLVTSGSGSKVTSWMFQCHSPVDITADTISEMIDLGLKVQKNHFKRLASIAKVQAPNRAKFGQLSVHPATLPRLQSDRGAILDSIESQTGGKIHVGDDGLLNLFAPSPMQYEQLEEAVVRAAGANLVPGRVYKSRVTSIKDFGAFVELPGSDIEALLHISEISYKRIASVEDELSLLQELDVVFQGRDKMGNLRVSLKAAAEKKRDYNE